MSEKYFTVNIRIYLNKDDNAPHTLSALAFEIYLIQNTKSDSLIYLHFQETATFFFFILFFHLSAYFPEFKNGKENKITYLFSSTMKLLPHELSSQIDPPDIPF